MGGVILSDDEQAQEWAHALFEEDEPGWSTAAVAREHSDTPTTSKATAGIPRCHEYIFDGASVVLESPGPGCEGYKALSTRVWRAALILCRLLVKERARVDGARVLELGAGMGLCGMLAARLGAKEVTLTDCSYVGLKWLLRNARREDKGGGVSTPGPADWGDFGDARHVVKVRRHLWEADRPSSLGHGAPQHWSNVVDAAFGVEGPPADLPRGATFDLVIASDVLYFHDQVFPLLCTLAARIAPGGCGVQTVTLRRPAVLQAFVDGLAAVGLQLMHPAEVVEVDPLDLGHLQVHSAGGGSEWAPAAVTQNELGPVHALYVTHHIGP